MAFWAVEVEPGKEYTTVLSDDLLIKQAVLGATAKEGERNLLHVIYGDDKKDFVICSLRAGHTEQVPLKLIFEAGEKIGFKVSGSSSVHVAGTLLKSPDYDSEDFDSDELEAQGLEDDESADSEEEARLEEEIKQAVLNASKKRGPPIDGDQKEKHAKKHKTEEGAKPEGHPGKHEGGKHEGGKQEGGKHEGGKKR